MSDDVLEQAIGRLREQADRREQGLQEDRRRAERHEDKWDDERLASERGYATVPEVRLADLSAILAALTASRSYSDEIEDVVERIARDECARMKEEEGAPHTAACYRQGAYDGTHEFRLVARGVRAALKVQTDG